MRAPTSCRPREAHTDPPDYSTAGRCLRVHHELWHGPHACENRGEAYQLCRRQSAQMTATRRRERSVTLDEGDAGDAAHKIHLQTASVASRGHRAAASRRCQELRKTDAARRSNARRLCKRCATDRQAPPHGPNQHAQRTLWSMTLRARSHQAATASALSQPTDWRTQP